MENIGAKIKELRVLKGLTQEDLAEQTGLSVRTIQRIESGEVDPRTYTLTVLATALEVDLETFTSSKINSPKPFSKDVYSWVILLHFSGILIMLFPPLLIWLYKRNELIQYEQHFKDVINFQISMFIYLFGSAILLIVLIGLPLLILLSVFSQVVIIINTIKVMNHQDYRYPLNLKIIK